MFYPAPEGYAWARVQSHYLSVSDMQHILPDGSIQIETVPNWEYAYVLLPKTKGSYCESLQSNIEGTQRLEQTKIDSCEDEAGKES